MKLGKKFKYFLVFINLIWAISAVIYDYDKIISLPFYYWPFILICPAYPLLLAAYWILEIRKKQSQPLLAFVSVPSLVYLFATVIYYPTWMILNGFDILAFGQIFWVAVYGLQGLFLIISNRIKPVYLALVSIFLLISFYIQFLTGSFGFFDTSNFNQQIITTEYLAVATFTLVLFLVLVKRSIKLQDFF